MSLSTDLLHIRNLLQLSVEDVHQLTKMPVDIIHSIENGGIFEDSSKNVTYQRSFVRSYSKALKIREDHIVQALDEHFDGRYSNLLMKIYGDPSKLAEQKSDKKQRKKIASEEEFVNPVRIQPKTPPQSAQTEIPSTPAEVSEEQTSQNKKPEARVVHKAAYPDLPPQPSESPYNKTQAPPSIQSVNWADVGKKTISFTNLPKMLAATVLILVAIAGVYWLITSDVFSGETKQSSRKATVQPQVEQPAVTPELLVESPTPEAEPNVVKEQEIPQLPDTLSLVIYASIDKLEPVRVKTDLSGSYFPYWIEQGQAMRFQFKDSISIRGQYNRMSVLFNNHLIEEFKDYRGPNREIILTRSLFESNPKWAVTLLDSTEIKNQPDTVLDRPVFN